jgi:cold shock CspA family protein
MRGTMLWFNREKDIGVIEAEDGARLDVLGSDFRDALPPLRCRGTAVEFSVADGRRHATGVSILDLEPPRRARRRSGGRSIA